MATVYAAKEVLGTMPDEESGSMVVRAKLECGCIIEKMVPMHHVQTNREGRQVLQGKYPCSQHRRPYRA